MEDVTTVEQSQLLLKDLQQVQLETLPFLKKDAFFEIKTYNVENDRCVVCSLNILHQEPVVTLNLFPFFDYEENLEKLAKFKSKVKDFIEKEEQLGLDIKPGNA